MSQKSYQYPFGEFMQQCELNFSLLGRLMPNWLEEQEFEYLLDDGTILRLTIQERHTYTSFIRLENINQSKDTNILDFKLDLRLYHDARQAEVFTPDGRAIEAKNHYPNRTMIQKDEKYNINHFLGDILLHCLRHGRSAEAIV